ncbi:MAG: nucleotidyltransferase family protein [bacterium]|nr:nucleotidyltransferase family protein [bacterium]
MNHYNLDILKQHREKIIAIAAKYGVKNIRVFGSVVRGESDELSDVDFLVSLDRGVTLMKMSALRREIEAVLGCNVDIISDEGLKESIKEKILSEAVPL